MPDNGNMTVRRNNKVCHAEFISASCQSGIRTFFNFLHYSNITKIPDNAASQDSQVRLFASISGMTATATVLAVLTTCIFTITPALSAFVCRECPENFYCKSAEKFPCPDENPVSLQGAKSENECTTCYNKTQNPSQVVWLAGECVSCAEGDLSLATPVWGGTSCTTCFAVNGTSAPVWNDNLETPGCSTCYEANGLTAPYWDGDSCEPCSSGSSWDVSSLSCVCNAGYYGDGISCTICPKGSYCEGGTAIATCPSKITTASTGATSSEDCIYLSEAVNSCEIGYIAITTAERLAKIGVQENYPLSGSYCLMNDISLSAYSSGEGWVPIGNSTNKFAGVFDGNNKKITDLYINRSGLGVQGLFGDANGATFRNLTINGTNIYSGYSSGGLVGTATNTTISHVNVDLNISSTGDAGILAGNVANTTVTNSSSTGNVKIDAGSAGLLIGAIIEPSILDNCSTIGTIRVQDANIGGLIGWIKGGEIKNSSANATLTTTTSGNIGGLAGVHSENTLTINNSSSQGIINSQSAAGGLIGTSLSELNIQDSYSTSNVNATNCCSGGLVGVGNNKTIITNSYTTSGTIYNQNSTAGGLIGWAQDAEVRNSNSSSTVTGNDRAGGLIGTINGSSVIADSQSNGNIRANDLAGGLIGRAVATSTISGAEFTGTVYGGTNSGGLIGVTNGANSRITHSYSSGKVNGGVNAGGLIGKCAAKIDITESHASGTVDVTSTNEFGYSGGLVGVAGDINSIIYRCYSSADVNTSTANHAMAGGLIGLGGTIIRESHSKGKITTSGSYTGAGGIFGVINHATEISNTYSNCNVYGENDIGGLVGQIATTGSAYITNTFFYGNTSGKTYSTSGYIGGILSTPNISNSYYDINVNPQMQAFGQCKVSDCGTGAIAKTTAELQTPSTYTGWDTTVWSLVQGSYPKLIGVGGQ